MSDKRSFWTSDEFGCAVMALGLALAFAIVVWTVRGFPAFWK